MATTRRVIVGLCVSSHLLFACDAQAPPFSSLVGPLGAASELDCALRNLTWEYGQQLGSQPGASLAMLPPFQSLFDALRLDIDCGILPPKGLAQSTHAPYIQPALAAAATYYADPVHGNDGNNGTEAFPFLTVNRAVVASRAGPAPASIFLRQGTFFLPATLNILPIDSGLSIAAYPNESETLSGGMPLLGLNWSRTPAPPSPPMTAPIVGSILAWNGSDCVTSPGATRPGVCVPLGSGTPDAAACAVLCLTSPSCTGYTWHDATTGTWHEWCYARVDGFRESDGRAGHESAWRVEPVAIWTATVAPGVASFDQLFIGAVRAVRARWPNANPEEDIAPTGYATAAGWLPPAQFPPPVEAHVSDPNRSSYDPFFPTFQWGWNGSVGNFTTGSFWGTKRPPAGAQYEVPSGVVLPPDAPNASSWDISAAVVHAFHCSSWGDWAFVVDASGGPPASVNGSLRFARGGWQEARGCATGGGFFVENVPQLIDAAGEWHFDPVTRTLLMAFNASTLPNATTLYAAQLATVVQVSGAADSPVDNVRLGPQLTFTHTTTDYTLPYTVPSGGDWSFHAGAAVSLAGTTNVVIQGCRFTRVGGNGLLIGGYNRATSVQGNEFSYAGASGIVVAGLHGFNITGGLPDYPEGTMVTGNLGHELGLFVKQSGFLYSAISANTSIAGNVFFNGPRAGINVVRDSYGQAGGLSVMPDSQTAAAERWFWRRAHNHGKSRAEFCTRNE